MLFYPRKAFSPCPGNAFDLEVPVEDGVSVVIRFYVEGENNPSLLYFHGNGEVIYDYDDLAPIYNDIGLNIIVADYRGYGSSGGSPSFTSMCHDAGLIMQKVQEELANRGFRPELWIMGRSLGSLSALELAAKYPDQIKGLIVESGFANVVRVMKGLDHFPREVELPEFDRECLEMVQRITIPTLVLHGDMDEIVRHSEGEFIYQNLGTEDKRLLTVANAGHNDIMYVGMREYFAAIVELVQKGLANNFDG
jgi:pimeloyl-ACP methyl ester carboxylesterase